jgi:hypothetical protein
MEKKRGRPRKDAHPQSVEDGNAFQNSKQIDDLIDNTNFDFIDDHGLGKTPEVETFNPLGDVPIHRDYSSPNVEQGVMQDLDEPQFHKTTFTEAQQQKENTIKTANADNDGKMVNNAPADGLSNPALNDLDEKDKKVACEQLVEVCLDTYETLWSLAGNVVKVSDKKIKQLVKEGKLDPQKRIPIDDRGTTVTSIEFIQSFNAQVPDAVEADPAFRKKVAAPLTRIFQKKGWGISDEQTVMFAVIKDSATKAMSAWALKKSINDVLERLAEEQEFIKEQDANRSTVAQEEYEPEVVTDEQLEFERRYQEAMREQRKNIRKKKPQAKSTKKAKYEQNVNTERMDINFDDNPLRTPMPPDYPAPNVEEKFVKGQEI